MPDVFHEWQQKLLAPTPSRRREALAELQRELSEHDLQMFCLQAQEAPVPTALQLCPLLRDAQREPLAELACNYAASADPLVREYAVVALGRMEEELRTPRLLQLLRSSHADVRRLACATLADCGTLSARDGLVALLDDAASEVVTAAIAALERLEFQDIATPLSGMFSHPSADVAVRAIEAAAELFSQSLFPKDALLGVLESADEEAVLCAACWAVDRHPFPEAIARLLDLLAFGEMPSASAAAAVALRQFPVREVIEALARQAATSSDTELTLHCKRSLGAMPGDKLVSTLTGLLGDPDPAMRMEVAGLLGDVEDDVCGELLVSSLSAEEDPLVKAALAEALGRGGWGRHWNELRALTRADEIVAYAAVNALSELLDAAHLLDFIRLLDETDSDLLREAVLKSLSLYGRPNGIPAEAVAVLEPFLRHPGVNIGMLAYETIGCVRDARALSIVIRALRSVVSPVLRKAAVQAIYTIAGGDLAVVYAACVPDDLLQLRCVLELHEASRAEDLPLYHELAKCAATGNVAASGCLEMLARNAPKTYLDAMRDGSTEEVETMLRVWQELPEDVIDTHPLELEALLKSPSARVRHETLRSVQGAAFLPDLALLTASSMRDEDEQVRFAACEAVRRLVEL